MGIGQKGSAGRGRIRKAEQFFQYFGASSGGRGQEFLPDGTHESRIPYTWKTIARKRKEWKRFADRIGPYPDSFSGRGIVSCAGGASYFTCAWVNIRMLRKKGCSLPVELWYQEGELNREIIQMLERLDVVCKKFSDYTDEKIINPYQLKPLALLHSRFREVLYLDADNNCLRDPAYLFDSPFYQKYGAVFWPDYWKTSAGNPIWKIVNSRDFNAPEQESGQLLINKETCWKALNLCLHFNLDPFYYEILWGDKDTFRFAWLALRMPFYMMGKGVGAVGFRDATYGFRSIAMVQHDYEGEAVFIHSNLLKWDSRPADQRFWKEVRRIPAGTRQKRIDLIYHPEFKKYFLTFEGEREAVSEGSEIAGLELESLKILEELRDSEFYRYFLETFLSSVEG